MAITSENYNKLIASGKTPQQIQEAINKQFGVNSNESKVVSSFIGSQTGPSKNITLASNTGIQTPQQAKTQGVKVLTPEQLKAKNKVTTPIQTGPITLASNTGIQTPQQAKTQGVNVLTPEQLKAKNKVTTTVTPTITPPTTDKNLESLNKLKGLGYTDDQIKSALEKKYGKNSPEYNKALGIMKVDTENKIKTEAEKSDITKNITTDIFKQNKDQLLDTRGGELEKFKKDDLKRIESDFGSLSKILNTNNSALLSLYGLKKDETGNMVVDTTNKNGIAYQLQQRKTDFETLKNKEFSGFRSIKYQGILGNIKAQAAARGIDLSKVPPEQLIALSDKIGQSAVTEVYSAKEKMLNDIQTYSDNTENQINLLREKGLISDSEAIKNIETIRQSAEAQKSTINKEYVTTMLGLAEGKATESEANKTNILNTITTLGTQLGLSGTSLGILNSYIGNFNTPQEAYQTILNDLANTNSQLYKSLKSQEDAAAAQQAFKNQLELLKAQDSGNTSDNSTKFNALQQTTLGQLTGYNIKTVDDLQNILQSGNLTQEQRDNVDKFLGGTFAGSLIPTTTVENQVTTTQQDYTPTQQELVEFHKISKAPDKWTQNEINDVIEAKKKSLI